jgi:hypothetical protein
MANNLIKSQEGFVWLEVTDKARKIYESQAFELFHVWRVDGKVFRIPIGSVDDLNDALDTSFPTSEQHSICIEVGDDTGQKIDFVTLESWDEADKIQHNGYIYVRYADLSFCK